MDVLFDAEDGAPEVRWTSGLRRPKRALARGDLEFFQNLTNPVRKEVLTPSPEREPPRETLEKNKF